jgi:hypothetical protein
MGRPKASQRIKCIAMAFIRVMTKPEQGAGSDEKISVNSQFCRKSLHSGMVQCLAHLTRCGDHHENREVLFHALEYLSMIRSKQRNEQI